MNKFKVGDKVRVLGYPGMVGVVRGLNNATYCTVDFGSAMYCFKKTEIIKLVEQKEKEMTFKNMKFDVAAIAKQLNVEHEEASRIIQEALFEQGYEWNFGANHVRYTDEPYIFTFNNTKITYGTCERDFISKINKQYSIKPTYTIVEAARECEIVELNGKKYNKQELEKALSLLKPIE